jgi:photosystem II stability/assembly factor-like uncharacterized protein
MCGSGPNDVYVVGASFADGDPSQGVIYRSSDGGETWQQQAGPFRDLYAIWGSGPGDIYAVGQAGAIYHTADSGETWRARSHLASAEILEAIWGASPRELYAVGWGGAVLRTRDAGETWRALRSHAGDQLEAIWGSGPGDIYAVGNNTSERVGVILRSGDGGETWAEKRSPHYKFYGVWGSGPGDVYIAATEGFANGVRGVVLRSQDGGKIWLRQALAEKGHILNAVWGSGPNDVYAAGWADSGGSGGELGSGVIYHSSDGGEAWRSRLLEGSGCLFAVWGSGPGDVYVAGQRGGIYHSADGGETWRRQESPTQRWLNGVGGVAGDIYAVGESGALMHTADAGETWRLVESGFGESLRDVWASAPGVVRAVGDNGAILRLR